MLSIDGWNIISRAGTDQLQHSKIDPLKINRKNSLERGPNLDTVTLEYYEKINLAHIPFQATLQVNLNTVLFGLECLLELNSLHCKKQKDQLLFLLEEIFFLNPYFERAILHYLGVVQFILLANP